MRKASDALYCFTGAIAKRWTKYGGLGPRNRSQGNTEYRVFFRWRALGKTNFVEELEHVQRATLIQICGALRTTPIMALNAITKF